MNIDNAKKINGWMYEIELEQLADWASQHNMILEIGPWKGRSTRAICDNTEGLVVSVDHWKGPEDIENWKYDYSEILGDEGSTPVYNLFKQNLEDHIASGKLTVVKADSLTAITRLSKKYDKTFDMIFIDEDHSYEHTKKVIKAYLTILRSGGIICGHDFNVEGVFKAVKELLPNYKAVGNLWYAIV